MFKDFKFGRNLLSFLIVIGGIIVLCLIALFIYMPVSAVNYHNSTTFTPYQSYTDSTGSDVNPPSGADTEGLEYIKYEDFKDFDIKFTSVKYQAKDLTIKLKFEENDRTNELNITKEKTTTRGTVVCTSAPYANKLDYATYRSSFSFGTDYEFKLSKLSYPITVSNFPVYKTIIKPNVYLYVKYQYMSEGARLITKKYSIEFTPEQYYDESNKKDFCWYLN